jgi:alcohol dehydrogenase class IV
MNPYRYFLPTDIVFGPGVLNQLSQHAQGFGKRPLIVTGRNSARATGLLDRVLAQLPNAVIFDEIDENPTTGSCDRGADFCRAHDCDCVIALGGGSPMDAAKAIAGLALNPGTCEDYIAGEVFSRGVLPVIAIPTTAGTGSETTPYAVLVSSRDNNKRTIAGRYIFPRLALLDPEITVTMPRPVTINTGLDALSQAMEGFVSRRSTPVGDALALDACRRVMRWLPTAADNGANIEARSNMLHAAMLTGCVISQSGTTLVHGMGYYLTLNCGLAHGLANGYLLAPVFQYNARIAPDRVRALAEAMNADPAVEPGKAVAQRIHELFGALNLSPAARDAGVDESLLRGFSEHIHTDRSRFKNQPGNPSVDELEAMFRAAWAGSLLE